MISAPACSTFGVQQVQVGAVRGLLQLGIRVLGEAVAHRFDSLGEVGVLEDEAVELVRFRRPHGQQGGQIVAGVESRQVCKSLPFARGA